jgi:futalosine hydrolase
VLQALSNVLSGRKLLLAVAAPSEARAVMAAFSRTDVPEVWRVLEASPATDVLMTGVGKANAAGAVSRALDPLRHGAVLSVGVAGAYTSLTIGSVVAATASIYADEGVQGPGTFTDIAALGFPPADLPGTAFPASAPLLDALRPHVQVTGPIATVSSCSGTDALARERAARTGSIAESMEGAAVLHVAHRLGVPAGELRVISNSTGDRERQSWDLPHALRTLTAVIGRMCA